MGSKKDGIQVDYGKHKINVANRVRAKQRSDQRPDDVPVGRNKMGRKRTWIMEGSSDGKTWMRVGFQKYASKSAAENALNKYIEKRDKYRDYRVRDTSA